MADYGGYYNSGNSGYGGGAGGYQYAANGSNDAQGDNTNTSSGTHYSQQPQPASQQQYAGGYTNAYANATGEQHPQQQYTDPNEGYYAQQQNQNQSGGYEYNGAQHHQQQDYYSPGQPQPQQQGVSASSPSPALAAANAVDVSGLRWAWSTYPNTVKPKIKEHASAASIALPEMVIPMSCMYTPLQPLPLECMVLDDPLSAATNVGQQVCLNCGAFWNRHSYREERQGGSWVCMSCQRRNQLPVNYSPEHPAMLYDTVEYILPEPAAAADGADSNADLRHPVFVFVVDTCLPHEEITALKANLQRCLAWLPPQSLIGFIAFGARATVWELDTRATAGLSKCYALRGDMAYEAADMPRMLQVSDAQPVRGRFLCPLADCLPMLTTLINELQSDGAPQRSNRRPLRTTGTAVGVAAFLMESLRHHALQVTSSAAGRPGGNNAGARGRVLPVKTAGKVLLFTGGPCTRGLGMIVGTDKAEMMRFHRDIIEGNTPYYEKAHEVYNDLDKRLAAVDGCLDVFAHSFDQIGVMEMRNCVNNTGGVFICGDSFAHDNFARSFERYFDRCDLRIRDRNSNGTNENTESGAEGEHASDSFIARCVFGVHMELHTSADTLVCGVLGPCNVDTEASKGNVHRAASPLQVGVGATTRWCVSSLDQGVALAYVFDTATLEPSAAAAPPPTTTSHSGGQSNRFIQFVTRYVTPNGQRRIRVTSVAQPIAPTNALADYYVQNQTFDQTCASTIIARMAVSILERYPNKWDDAKRWVDTLLVKFVRRYGVFSTGRPDSLRLDPCLSLFPSFLFNLRRSEYFLVLNISPDETTFKRHWLMREPVDSCVLMIQPTLDSYDLEAPYATAVPLDSSSLRHDNIVLMDAFFNVHIMWGTTIYEWIEAEYQNLPDYAYFADLLQAAETDALAVLARRYPYPRFSRTSANGSEARHVKTRVNPATTHHHQPGGIGGGLGGMPGQPGEERSDLIYTDDASIAKFMTSLKQAVVTPAMKEGSVGGVS